MATVNEERVVDHITICLSKFENMFFSLPDSHLKVEMISKRVKRRREFDFEVPCNYCWTGQEKAIEWIKKIF